MTSSSTREPAMVDVARLAGVSHQTVSRVLNNHPNVRVETARRVRAAIAELGYRPNRAARALVTGRSQLLGVVALNTTLFGPASLLTAFEQAAGAAGFAVSVGSVDSLDRRTLSDVVERHLDQRVAGIVAIAPVASAAEALDGIAPEVPLVTVDGDPTRPAAGVTVDQADGARLATQHLLDAGHRTVWHVTGPPEWFDSAGRVAGWEATLRAAGAEVPPVLPADWSAASGYRVGQMLARIPEVTAVFAANDHLALGLLRALHERGLQVPQRHQHRRLRRRPRVRVLHPAAHHDPPRLPRRRRERPRPAPGADRLGGALDGAACPRPALVERASVAPPRA